MALHQVRPLATVWAHLDIDELCVDPMPLYYRSTGVLDR
jgi:hypothetical protein